MTIRTSTIGSMKKFAFHAFYRISDYKYQQIHHSELFLDGLFWKKDGWMTDATPNLNEYEEKKPYRKTSYYFTKVSPVWFSSRFIQYFEEVCKIIRTYRETYPLETY